jgi:hypothetical protein
MEKRIFLIMNGNFDDRFDLEDVKKVIETLDNGSFVRLLFEYQPSLGQFTYHPEFNELGYTSNYNSFVTDVQNSVYGQFFIY